MSQAPNRRDFLKLGGGAIALSSLSNTAAGDEPKDSNSFQPRNAEDVIRIGLALPTGDGERRLPLRDGASGVENVAAPGRPLVSWAGGRLGVRGQNRLASTVTADQVQLNFEDATSAGLVNSTQIDQLALPSRAAGSEILECTTEEEIPVKISRGEYTDDFLVEPDD